MRWIDGLRHTKEDLFHWRWSRARHAARRTPGAKAQLRGRLNAKAEALAYLEAKARAAKAWLPNLLQGVMHHTAVVVSGGLMAATVLSAQTAPMFNREMIVLDPAHGGTDGGARINDHLEEKEITLAVAGRLRSLLAARGFTVVSTREGDPGALLTSDQRAEAANKARAVACLVIHASASGNGVYIGTSAIGSPMAAVPQALPVTRVVSGAVPWDRAQEAFVPQSLGLANQVGTALARAKVPLAIGSVALRPLDNMTCPAISIELSGMHHGSDVTPVSDEEYQRRVTEAIAGALVLWKNQAQQPEFVPVSRPGGGA